MSSDDARPPRAYNPTVPEGAGAGSTRASSEEPRPGTLEGQIVSGRYKVEKLLGVGGMGCVYRAEHVHMRKTVALKTLHPEMTQLPEAVARFEREAVAASRIDHPNVAAATDFGRLDDGSYFLVLQFVEGKSLRDTIDEIGVLPVDRALRIAREVALALKAAHALEIVHRDLKPDNVMLVQGELGESVKVLDFGIAKVTIEGSGGLTRMGSVFGTPEYMSPEQCMGQPVDARSDVYALGVILYEMLVGHTPFKADDAVVLLRKQIVDPPPPLPPGLPESVEALVAALLAKSVADRVQSAQDIIQAIEVCLASLAGPPLSPVVSQAAPMPVSARSVSLPGIPPSNVSAPVAIVRDPSSPSLGGPLSAMTTGPTSLQVTSVPQPAAPRAPKRPPLDDLQKLASQPVRIGKTQLPLGIVAATAVVPVVLGLLGIVLLAVIVRSCSTPDVTEAANRAAAIGSATGPEPSASAAGTGSTASRQKAEEEIDRIEGIAVYKRSDDDWVSLARSYSEVGRYEDAARAYRSALSVRSSIRKDPVVLDDLKRAGRDSSAFPIVVNLCETVLGKRGLDLMWELWQEARKDPARSDQADTLRKKLIIMSRRAAPALRVAIDLEATGNCEKLAAILPRAIKEGDVRSLERLQALAKKTGCGDSDAHDCYPCLRSSSTLARATESVRARPAPKLGQTADADD